MDATHGLLSRRATTLGGGRSATGAHQSRRIRTRSMDSSPPGVDGRQQTSPRGLPTDAESPRRGEVDPVSARTESERPGPATTGGGSELVGVGADVAGERGPRRGADVSPRGGWPSTPRRPRPPRPPPAQVMPTRPWPRPPGQPSPRSPRATQPTTETRRVRPRPARRAATCSTRRWAVAPGAQDLRSTWTPTEGLSRPERPRLRARRPG